MNNESALHAYEISPRFRQSLEERIARLERDAAEDERMLPMLRHEDHTRRHRRLVAAQCAEALRIRMFLDRSRPRFPRPLIAL
jgi:ribosome-associated translation inhibitor RaiA